MMINKLLPALLILFFAFLNNVNAQDTTTQPIDSNINNLTYEAEFPGGKPAWNSYLKRKLNTKLGEKYIVIPEGQYMAKVKVVVSFVVGTKGDITDVKVIKTEPQNVHQAFLVEAIRIIETSPRWVPAIQKGRLVKFRVHQPITWVVNKE